MLFFSPSGPGDEERQRAPEADSADGEGGAFRGTGPHTVTTATQRTPNRDHFKASCIRRNPVWLQDGLLTLAESCSFSCSFSCHSSCQEALWKHKLLFHRQLKRETSLVSVGERENETMFAASCNFIDPQKLHWNKNEKQRHQTRLFVTYWTAPPVVRHNEARLRSADGRYVFLLPAGRC